MNPVDVWKLFSEARSKNKEKISEWLSDAAAEARHIADVWMGKYDGLSDSMRRRSFEEFPKNNANHIDDVVEHWDTMAGSNVASYARLEGSYESASNVFQEREAELRDSFANSASQVLARRNEVKSLYERLYGKGQPAVFLDNESHEKQLDDLQSSVELLNREAAALEVLARNYKASH